MKTPCSVLVSVIFAEIARGALIGDAGGTNEIAISNHAPAYIIRENGANNRVWYKVTTTTNRQGQTITITNRAYEELALGLNYWDSEAGQWKESKEEILPSLNGGAAVKGQHQVYFPYDIYAGVIETVTPNGIHLKSRPIGICYFDGTNSVMIADLTNSVGQILSSENQVIYTNAFTDFSADVLATYRKSGFECDLVFREQPPGPEEFGLNPGSSHLALLTEFFDAPEPEQTIQGANEQGGLTDTTLDFNGMKMVRGRAFAIGSGDTDLSLPATLRSARVYKRWTHLDGRTVLIEEVPLPKITSELQRLPQAGTQGHSSIRSQISPANTTASLRLPAKRKIQGSPKALQLARADLNKAHGFVLDYTTINANKSNFTFQADTTYLVNGFYAFSGTTIIEGGTVIKFVDSNSPAIDLYGPLVCQTASYRPAIFTSRDDNTVGETISGSTGNPVLGQNTWGLVLEFGATTSVNNMRFSYLQGGIAPVATTAPLDVWDCQFIQCWDAIDNYANYGTRLHNVLASRCAAVIANQLTSGLTLSVEHLTADVTNFWDPVYSYSLSALNLTNSIIRGTIGGGATLNTNAVVINPSGPLFQTAGSGSYYLTNGSVYRNAGTTNFTLALLTEIKTKTTYPPILYSNISFSVSTNLGVQAQRDTDTPDFGYHYDPLDYLLLSPVIQASMTITSGVALGFSGAGFDFTYGGQFTSQGHADNLSRLVWYNTVQEQATWGSSGGAMIYPSFANVQCRFTEFSRLGGSSGTGDYFLDSYDSAGTYSFRDCQFLAGEFRISSMTSEEQGGEDLTLTFTNCVFERTAFAWKTKGYTLTVFGFNNLFRAGVMSFDYDVPGFDPSEGNSLPMGFLFRDNLFDKTRFFETNEVFGVASLDIGYSGYVTNQDRIDFFHDVVITDSPTYQKSALGNYYLPTNSTLLNVGSRNANVAGLYHYTTQTNQVKETNSTVDIGFHYVAVDSNGNPIDTDGDGVPDYLEDANGNGLVDGSEVNWLLNGFNGLSSGNELQVFTPLK
jgi:hypothetical protein